MFRTTIMQMCSGAYKICKSKAYDDTTKISK